MRDYTIFLADIVEAMEKIEQYTSGMTYEEFVANGMAVDAVARNLGVIGEAAGKVPAEIRKAHDDIPWSRIIGLRNIVVHEYFGRPRDRLGDSPGQSA